MGIGTTHLEVLKKIIDNSEKKKLKMVSVGYPDIICQIEHLTKLFGEQSIRDLNFREDSDMVIRWHAMNKIIPGVYESYEFFEKIGIELTVLDIAKIRGGEVIADLNAPVNVELEGKFDIVLDPGTMEHCFNIGQAMVNFLSMAKIGGYIYHSNPLFMFNHGFYNLNPTFYNDFYVDNGHSISALFGVKAYTDDTRPHYEAKFHLPHTDRKILHNVDDSGIHVVAQKKSDKYPKWPVQTKYKILNKYKK